MTERQDGAAVSGPQVEWICTGYSPRHAGLDKVVPARCPYCGATCRKRTTCGCGNPIDECRQSICHHPFASAD